MTIPKFYTKIGGLEFTCPFKLADYAIRYLSTEQLVGVREMIRDYGKELIAEECYELMPELTILINELDKAIKL